MTGIRRLILKCAVLISMTCLITACGAPVDPGVVGGSCKEDRDCAERCLGGKDFPGGMCSVECRDDRDCPRATWCSDKKGGVCLIECVEDADCPDRYECKSINREGAGGKMDVCIGD